MSHHSQSSKKEAGKHAKNAILREIQKNSRKPFAVHNSIFHFSKGFLIETNQVK